MRRPAMLDLGCKSRKVRWGQWGTCMLKTDRQPKRPCFALGQCAML